MSEPLNPLGAKFTVTLTREFTKELWNASWKANKEFPMNKLWRDLTGEEPSFAIPTGFVRGWFCEATFTFDNLAEATVFKLRWT